MINRKIINFILTFVFFSIGKSEELKVKKIVKDDSPVVNTASIKLEVSGGTAPYTYHWDNPSIGLTQNQALNLAEGETYRVKIEDSKGNYIVEKIYIPAKSFAEKVNAGFNPLVKFLNTILFFDPFKSFYDNRLYDSHGKPVLNPNGTPKTVKIPFLVVWLIIGAFFLTLRMGFINFKGIKHSLSLIRGKYDENEAPGQITHFQALTTALSGTVGLGNIAGVAVAVSYGGPGATLWMIIAGLLGMSVKFVECSLGVKYREIAPDGKVYGGPMNYLRKGFARRKLPRIGKGLSIFYALIIIIDSFAGGSMFSANQSSMQIASVFNTVDPNTAKLTSGIIIAILVFIVIVGGIKNIANVTDKIVPAMAIMYLIMSLVVIFYNIDRIGNAFNLIFSSAFSSNALYGGFIGVMIQGFRRAVFSNEAGMGSASIVHSAVKTHHPVSEGFVAMIGPFVDTVIICTLTALVLIFSGVYTDSSVSGSTMTAKGFSTVFGDFSNLLITIAIFLFAFSTIIAWSYYGLKATVYLFGNSKIISIGFKLVFISTIVFGSIVNLSAIIDLTDMMVLFLTIPNLIGLYLMSGEVSKDLKIYVKKIKSGEIYPSKKQS